MDKYIEIRRQAFEANMLLPKLGLVVGTFGNVSAADHGMGVFAIKPSGLPYELLAPHKMVIVDFEGNVVDGELKPSSDTPTHAFLYSNWTEVSGICHTHSTYATAWAQAQLDIPLYGTTHADHLMAGVPCAPSLIEIQNDYERQTGGQIISHLEEKGISPEMILVGGHGPFTWGKTAEIAVQNSVVLEAIAKMALLTEQINPGAPGLNEALIKKHYERKHGANAYYGQ